nr:hypothetical protein I302_06924 [Kwoniella bestiolae CBS 10118]OCF23938.1 hypothetical protein I302_06924 [Kwoniella bestiolae CBS 10118]
MINLRPTYFPPTATDEASSPSLKLLPDRVTSRGRTKKGKGAWVTCNEGIIAGLMSKKGPHIGFLRHYPSITIPENIQFIIHHQLLERIKIELQNLSNTLNSLSPRPRRESTTSEDRSASSGDMGYKPIMRRLTNAQVSSIPGLSNTILPDGVSVHPHPSSSVDRFQGDIIALLDISNLSPPASKSTDQDDTTKVAIPLIPIQGKSIPLYTLSTLFPPSLHTELDSQIKKILSIERRSKRRSILRLGLGAGSGPKQKSDLSDIIALYSHPSTEDRRGISGIPLAVALWRIRCFLGYGWGS